MPPVDFMIKPLETEFEMAGKADVHWTSHQETYLKFWGREYFDSLSFESYQRQAFDYPENTVVALVDSKVVGFVNYGRDDECSDDGQLYALYVLEDYHGLGIGKSLLQAGLSYLSDYPKIVLWVMAENSKAVDFYLSQGFEKDGQAKEIERGGKHRLIKMLKTSC